MNDEKISFKGGIRLLQNDLLGNSSLTSKMNTENNLEKSKTELNEKKGANYSVRSIDTNKISNGVEKGK